MHFLFTKCWILKIILRRFKDIFKIVYFPRVTAVLAEYNVSVCGGGVWGGEGGAHFAITGILHILIISSCQITR